MLKIGIFSKLSRISIRMLRHYDEIGLLVPEEIDRYTGYRYYRESQLSAAAQIAALRDMGFGLTAIGEILRSYDDPEAFARFLEIQRTQVRAQAEELGQKLLLLDTALTRLRKDQTMMQYNVSLKNLPERYVASVRGVIPTYAEEHRLWGILHQETGCLQPEEPSYGLAVFYDEGYKESDVDVEIQICVKGSHKNTEHVVFKTVPAVQIASATYTGSYDQLTQVNHAVANWVRDNGYEFDGASFCIYHVSPGHTQNPDEYVTEVCYPVKKA